MYRVAGEPDQAALFKGMTVLLLQGLFNLKATCAIVEHHLSEQHWSAAADQSYHQLDSSPTLILAKLRTS
jgi:hypothetical protein